MKPEAIDEQLFNSQLAASERNVLLHLKATRLEESIKILEEHLEFERKANDQRNAATALLIANLEQDRQSLIKALGRLTESLRASPTMSTAAPSRSPDQTGARSTSSRTTSIAQLRVAGIMDEFTAKAFDHACTLHNLSRSTWKDEIARFQPNILIVESAWGGLEESWKGKVNHLSPELLEVVSWCREHSIPTVFWNKEDPVHFDVFISTASIFDLVFTTDIDTIERYKRRLRHENVYLMPFFCEPGLHDPIATVPRMLGSSFAGAYYARYPERQNDFASIIQAVGNFGATVIYDRNHGTTDPNFQFPDEYAPLIEGRLTFDEIDQSYKGFSFGINLNSVKLSQSMYARRVYDLMLSNTLVVSNYSRGLRLMFGDLVISTDNSSEVDARLSAFMSADKESLTSRAELTRVLALRKVLLEHTTSNRLEYIASKAISRPLTRTLHSATIVGKSHGADETQALLEIFHRQNWLNKKLLLILDYEVTHQLTPDSCAKYLTVGQTDVPVEKMVTTDLVAFISAEDWHGPDYITDLALAFLYSSAEATTKQGTTTQELESRSQASSGDEGRPYQLVDYSPMRASMIQLSTIRGQRLRSLVYDAPDGVFGGIKILEIDRFNYRRAPHVPEPDDADEIEINVGLPMERLLTVAEAISPSFEEPFVRRGISGGDLITLLPNPSAKTGVQISAGDDRVVIKSTLETGRHTYIYAKERVPVEFFSPHPTGLINAIAGPGLKLSVVILFFDADGQRISNVIRSVNVNHEVEIPKGATEAHFGLRIQGSGSCDLWGLSFEQIETPPSVTPTLVGTDHLCVTNVYPSADALYRNGFVHRRVKGYQNYGIKTSVFCLNNRAESSYEHEGVDVLVGGKDRFHSLLRNNRFRTVSIHFLDDAMWDVVRDEVTTTRFVVWLHGAEVQPWYRRHFNYSSEPDRELAQEASAKRMELWKEVFAFDHPNLHFVFVSAYFANEVMEDVGIFLQPRRCSIIHNFIDTDLFEYHKKDAEQRFKILSVRPFASKKYANDLSVAAITQLSTEEFFKDLDIRIIGDGPLFEEELAPLRDFPNVRLERRFVPQNQIAELHREYGVFLCPTRMDSQGVSRDEAMSSGLVPVTNSVTAIPEFVDAGCGILADGEDHMGMAAGIKSLVLDQSKFLQMSARAAARVREQSSLLQTIGEEVKLI